MFTINALSIREANGAMLMKMLTIKVRGVFGQFSVS